jgi:Cys-tRNA(Pro)/Cys-tRNA(Cys) deacylase
MPAHRHLEERGIPWQRLTFSPSTPKGAASVAHALGFRESQMVKTLIFESGTGERALIAVGGDRNVISGKLKKAMGNRNIRLASPDAVLDFTGYRIGSIPPFSWQEEGTRTFIDEDLMEEPILGVGAGVWGEEIMITPPDLVRAANGIVVNLTRRD